jgi:subtilisin family serine protease
VRGLAALGFVMLAPLSIVAMADPASSAKPDSHEVVGFYHVFEGRRLPLELDTTRYAVHADDAAAGTLDVESSLPIHGWRLVRAGEAARSGGGVVQEVAAVALREDLGFVSPVFIGDDGGPVIVTRTLLIGIDPALAPAAAERMIAERVKGDIIERDWANMPGAYRVSADTRNGIDVLNAANALAQTPGVLWAEPDMIFTGRGSLIPNDTLFSGCWGLHNTGQSGGLPDFDMDCPEAWDITTGDPSIIVVVIDNGVDPTHPDINQITGEDFTNDVDLNGAPVNPCDVHGTAVAGCVSGIINNSIGIVGSAPGCTVASARPFVSNQPCDGMWTSFSSWTVNALAWAESIGARVSNNSNGYGFTSSAIATKYSSTRANGMVHFASAGNNASTTITYPSSLSTVNSVLALNRSGGRANFSNWGNGSGFSAPGESITTTDRQGAQGYVSGDYVVVDGTSFATPYTAGVAALLLSIDPSLTSSEVEQALRDGATDLGSPGYDTDFGWGLVNARTTIARAPGFFEITAPLCNGGVALTTIEWQPSILADDYTVEIATDAGFTGIAYSQSGIIGTQHTIPPGAIAACDTHYIRVTAFNTTGQTAANVAPCPFFLPHSGDINLDGVVDTSDLGGLLINFGGAGPFADLNGDGAVDTADLGALIGQFGQGCAMK